MQCAEAYALERIHYVLQALPNFFPHLAFISICKLGDMSNGILFSSMHRLRLVTILVRVHTVLSILTEELIGFI